MLDVKNYPFGESELAEDYVALPKEEVSLLSRKKGDVEKCKGIGQECYSVVKATYLEAKAGSPAEYEWFHAIITTEATATYFGLQYDEEEEVYNDKLPMEEYGITWHLVTVRE